MNTALRLVEPCPFLQVVEVLILGRDEQPVAGIAIQLRNGNQAMLGRTGPDGLSCFDGVGEETCQLCPYELDRDAWQLLRTEALDGARARSQGPATWRNALPGDAPTSGATHTVASGEALDLIAFRNGHYPATIWDHAGNQELRARRESGNVLLPGDKLFVPPIRRGETDALPATRIILQLRGVPARLRLRLLDDLQPLPGIAWALEIPDQPILRGVTDADGIVEAFVPPSTHSAIITYIARQQQRRVTIAIGALTPAREEHGWRQRLSNLGFHGNATTTAELPEAETDRQALMQFQATYNLPITGKADAATISRLFKAHDSAAGAPTAGSGL